MCCGDIIQFFKYSTVSEGSDVDFRLLPALMGVFEASASAEFLLVGDVMSTTEGETEVMVLDVL